MYAKERRQNTIGLLLGVLGILALHALIFWGDPQFLTGELPGRVILASSLMVVPLVWALIKGVWQVRSEFAQNTHTLLRTLPVSGFAVLLAKYLWLWCEVALLTALVVGGVFVFIGIDIGWAQVGNFEAGSATLPANLRLGADFVQFTLLAALLVAPLPAIALLSSVLAKGSRELGVLVGFVAYASLVGLFSRLFGALGTLELNLPGLSLGRSFADTLSGARPLVVGGEFLLLSVVFTAAVLWAAGTLFQRQDA